MSCIDEKSSENENELILLVSYFRKLMTISDISSEVELNRLYLFPMYFRNYFEYMVYFRCHIRKLF